MVAYTFSLSTQKTEAAKSLWGEASLIYHAEFQTSQLSSCL